MRILQLGKFYSPFYGGIETVVYNLTEGLNEHGISCDVLCSNNKKVFVTDVINGYTVYRTKSCGILCSTPITPQMIGKLKELQSGYDIIHVHLPNPMANLALFLSRPSCPVVLSWHADIVRQKHLLKLYAPLQEWLLKRADSIVVATENHIAGSQFLSQLRDKISVIPFGIKENMLKADGQKVKDIKKACRGRKIVFSMGRLVSYKGFSFLIEAAKYLPEDFIIVIGGSGPLNEELEGQIAINGLSDKVILQGRIPDDDIGSWYAACDVFCLSSMSKAEAFGVVMIEAMSFGKPVVATKIEGSGVPLVNEDGVTGINVNIENPREIADAIVKICSDKQLYDTLSENAKKRFYKLFTRDKMIDSMISVYDGLLTKRNADH